MNTIFTYKSDLLEEQESRHRVSELTKPRGSMCIPCIIMGAALATAFTVLGIVIWLVA